MNPASIDSIAWQRFWSRVDVGPISACWEWTGPISHKGGYAQVCIKKRMYTAHRLSWYFTRGVLPTGLIIRHICDNPKCCNPIHLDIGTHLDNYKDMVSRGRRKVTRAKGERNCKAKLNETQVKEIRALYATGTTSTIKLAHKYNVTQGLISQIVLHRIWKHLND